MDGLFIVALTTLVISALFTVGFICTAVLIAIFKGPKAARQFIREEW
ncbi:hypothetical protein [Marinobacterium litorale]|nr:hypothetical protein [Marinobacterium litorale]